MGTGPQPSLVVGFVKAPRKAPLLNGAIVAQNAGLKSAARFGINERPAITSLPSPFGRGAGGGLRKTQRFEDHIIIRFLFQRTATADLASVERMIGHYSAANIETPPPPALCRWSE